VENAPADRASTAPEITASRILLTKFLLTRLLRNQFPSSQAQEAVPEPAAVHDVVTAGVESAAIAAATETGADHITLHRPCHRVMERLKPELVKKSCANSEIRNKPREIGQNPVFPDGAACAVSSIRGTQNRLQAAALPVI